VLGEQARADQRSGALPTLEARHGEYFRTKTRQTTHHQDDADSIVVTRKRHVFEGRRLFVIRSLVRRGVPEFLVILPDGSRTLIPAAWTDRNGGLDTKPSSTLVASADGLEDLCLIGDLLKVRAVVDALLSRLAESAPEQEGDHAVGVGVSRDSSGAGRTIKGALGTDRSRHRSPRWRFSHG